MDSKSQTATVAESLLLDHSESQLVHKQALLMFRDSEKMDPSCLMA